MRKFWQHSLGSYAHAPVLGVAFGFLFILGAIALSTHSLLAFFSIEGLVIVGGGVIGVAFMSFDRDDVHKALSAIVTMLKKPTNAPPDNLPQDMIEIISWAHMVKEKGMRRLEASLAINGGIIDPFVRYGLTMVIPDIRPRMCAP